MEIGFPLPVGLQPRERACAPDSLVRVTRRVETGTTARHTQQVSRSDQSRANRARAQARVDDTHLIDRHGTVLFLALSNPCGRFVALRGLPH